MTFERLLDHDPDKAHGSMKCNWCQRVSPAVEVLVDEKGDTYCPNCLNSGYLMRVEGDE